MNESLLLSILKDIVVPEVASFIASHYNTTGELPTQEQLQQLIDTQSTRILMKADALVQQVLRDNPNLQNS